MSSLIRVDPFIDGSNLTIDKTTSSELTTEKDVDKIVAERQPPPALLQQITSIPSVGYTKRYLCDIAKVDIIIQRAVFHTRTKT